MDDPGIEIGEDGVQLADEQRERVSLEDFISRAGDTCALVVENGWIQTTEDKCERPDHFEMHRPEDPSPERVKDQAEDV